MTKFWNTIITILTFYAAVITTILLCIGCPRNINQELGFDYIGAIVGILALMVALLLGWQIANFFMSKDYIKEMIDEKVGELANDYINVLETRTRAEKHLDYIVVDYDEPAIIEDCLSAIEKTNTFMDNRLKKYAIDDTLRTLQGILNQNDKDNPYKILKGKKNLYRFILKDIQHPYIESLLQIINEAEEV